MAEFIDTSIKYSELQDNIVSFKNKYINQGIIYHYTSMSGLKGIVENESIWFTNIKYMNDADEVRAGIDHTYKFIETLPEQYKNNLINPLNSITESNDKIFVSCFSLKRDLLSLWNYYTKSINNNGVNISFDYKTLIDSILRKNQELDGCHISFGIVNYSKEYKNSYIEKSIKNLITGFFNFTKEEPPYIKIPVFVYDGSKNCFCYTPLSDIFFYIKRNCFHHEKEFGIIITVPEKKIPDIIKSSIYKFREGNNILIPYLDIKFDLHSIRGITIAPTLNSDLINRNLNDFFEYKGLDVSKFADGIQKSSIPVRY